MLRQTIIPKMLMVLKLSFSFSFHFLYIAEQMKNPKPKGITLDEMRSKAANHNFIIT